jgi:hypothetical protein
MATAQAIQRDRRAADVEVLVLDVAAYTRRLLAHERLDMCDEDRMDPECVADCMRDCLYDAMRELADLSDGDYDWVHDTVIDLLKCNGNAVESKAASIIQRIGF